jgi:hypothetical protein
MAEETNSSVSSLHSASDTSLVSILWNSVSDNVLIICQIWTKWINLGKGQGDQNGRFFATWVVVYFWHFFENYRRSANYWATFSTVQDMYWFWQNMVGLHFERLFLQTHLVTLVRAPKGNKIWFKIKCGSTQHGLVVSSLPSTEETAGALGYETEGEGLW